MGVWAHIRRLWRSKGFGIHSPFAYKFVREVLCQSYAYYVYDRIELMHTATPRDKARARTVWRIVNYFRPSRLTVTGKWEKALVDAAGLVPRSTEGGSVALVRGDIPRSKLAGMLAEGTVIVTDPREALLDEAIKAMDHGMTFSNERDLAVIVPMKHLPQQNFQLKF